jgi:tetratricopeptide (TPR) repeat protein
MSKALRSSPPPGKAPDIRQAIELHRQGRLGEAERIYAAILAAAPARSDALHFLGLANYQQGRLPEALRLMAAALKADPGSADIHSNYGLALDANKQRQEALASFDKAIVLKPDHVQALSNRGLTLAALGRTQEALDSWRRALSADPDHAEALHSRGNALFGLKRHGEALADYDRFLAIRPGNPDVFNNRGSALSELGRLEEAIASYDRALALDPKVPEILINKGHVLADLHQFDAALACYGEAAALEGRRAEAEFSRSLVQLRLGQFAAGWRAYEWRWKKASWAGRSRDFAAPLWLGQQSVAGRTILLHSEQGFGDTLQFARYGPLIERLGGTVVLEVQPPLKALVAGLSGASRVLARGESLPHFDLHCPLMSLPLAFGTALDDIPADVPYLDVPADRVAKWRVRLGERRCPRVGIAWAGSAVHENNGTRSLPLTRFAALLSATGVEFVSLQKDLDAADAAALPALSGVRALGEELADFADTAAVISQLDLVVSVDTSVVHLAGALGAPVWVLLPFSPDFRWLLARADSSWYPTARLFRQPRPGDWDSVLARVRDELEAFSKGAAAAR